ncbi:hypothetical protein EDD15DRAFT_2467570 [Pisolithus albus]|nr:hypothetical protein EDD15DRAFT_2467570 [Pisolithus albus]
MTIPGGFGEYISGTGQCYPHRGSGLLHTYVYYMHYSEDDSTTKFIVAIVWILETLHVSFGEQSITNYGVPTSLEYIVWSFSASIFETTLVVTIVQLFFANMIYHMSRRKLRWLVTAPIVSTLIAMAKLSSSHTVVIGAISTASAWVWHGLINNAITYAARERYYTSFAAVFTITLAEVLNTASLCVLLYEKGSHSAVPRTKRLLNTLIIYAVNRCLLTLPIVLAEVIVDAEVLAAWTMALNFLTPKLYANSLLASLNTRQHLRSQGSSLDSGLGVNSVHFANPPKLSKDTGSSKDEVKQFDRCKVAVIDIATRGTFGEATTPQREVEV